MTRPLREGDYILYHGIPFRIVTKVPKTDELLEVDAVMYSLATYVVCDVVFDILVMGIKINTELAEADYYQDDIKNHYSVSKELALKVAAQIKVELSYSYDTLDGNGLVYLSLLKAILGVSVFGTDGDDLTVHVTNHLFTSIISNLDSARDESSYARARSIVSRSFADELDDDIIQQLLNN